MLHLQDTPSESSKIPSENNHTWIKAMLHRILMSQVLGEFPSDEEIQKRYIDAPDSQVELLCSYTTRLEGFIDILLSWEILTSKQATDLLGEVNTHRWSSMGWGKGRGINDYISFSTWFVSYKYSDATISRREDYIWWYGFFTKLETLLRSPLSLSHLWYNSSFSKERDPRVVSKEDLPTLHHLPPFIHDIRKKWFLYDDGYGNLFELMMQVEGSNQPEYSVYNGILAIPLSEKRKIRTLIRERQTYYKEIVKKLESKLSEHPRTYADNKYFANKAQTLNYLTKLTHPVDFGQLPIYRYTQKNLDIAMQYLSLKQLSLQWPK